MAERVVLAYSGGLDTSVAISWIQKETGKEVVAVALDLGQGGEDMEVIRQRALDCGAVEAVVVDAEQPRVQAIVQAVHAGVVEGRRLADAMAREPKSFPPLYRAMVAAGVVDDVDYFTAIHIGTGVPAGTVVCGGDNFMATTKFDVQFSGVAAHAGGKPEDGRNALLAAGFPETVPGTTVDRLVDNGVLEHGRDGTVRAALDIRPTSDGINDFLVVSDQDAALRSGPVRHDHVLGIGGASVSLAHAVVRTKVGRALDLGTGCGIQALHLNAHCEEIVATDTNPSALTLAAATARLNGMTWDLRCGSMFEPVAGEREADPAQPHERDEDHRRQPRDGRDPDDDDDRERREGTGDRRHLPHARPDGCRHRGDRDRHPHGARGGEAAPHRAPGDR